MNMISNGLISMNKLQVIDIYFQSNTYGKLIDNNTKLYQKTWIEIYKFLKAELKHKRVI